MNQNLALVQNGNVYTDYEGLQASINWCTPSLVGFSVCVAASASGGVVSLQLTLKTPFGNYSKTFNINANVCFNWSLPIKLGPSIEICIKDFTSNPTTSFTLNLSLCVSLPIIGKKCASWSHTFTIPFMNEKMLTAGSVSNEDLATLYLVLAHSAGEETAPCNCH